MSKPALQSCYQQLDECMLADRQGFYRRLQKLKSRLKKNTDCDAQLQQLADDIRQSVERVTQRRLQQPEITYPDTLPVSQEKQRILETIRDNPVTILCGETGSGKTTQLPKICLQLGLGARGRIGHTQPRRLAARSVASRIAEELDTVSGDIVGYKVRFSDSLSDKSRIKLMTDGILLAECQHDPFLNQYDTIIIDEAHERSLNIDFLLGYIKRLLDKRRDLKIIITSATIDPERFSRHFNDAPIIEVSGRTYPVDVLYRPLHQEDNDDDQQRDLQQGIIDAVDELSRISRDDILVFLSGERAIRETGKALQKQQLHNTEILPLLAKLSATEQNRIFHGSNQRRIILATNVAETSLTVPGIHYVIDSGLARISRYSWRSKMQRLPIEKVSQASANQRKGRCGRIAEGVCIRLYDEDDFNQRDEFTEPEIRRTSLAAVILQMENLGLGHIDDFPFVEPPDERLIKDGYKLLHELGAIDERYKLTSIGKKLARLPIDPRLGRILLEAEKEAALNEVLVIIAALATQDPRERPLDKQQAADEKHRAWQDKDSDFILYINLWNDFHAQKSQLSGNRLRKWCKQNFLSWMRIREWADTHKQIKRMLRDLKLSFNSQAADYACIHRSLLSGLLNNIGIKHEEREFTGARNRHFHIFPGSTLFKKPPQWVISAEIVETTKIYARCNAKIEPGWIAEKAGHLLKRSYADPHWEKRPAQVVASEQTSLYGLIINPAKKIHYGPIEPQQCRQIFIRSALVQRDFDCKAEFFSHNSLLIEQLEDMEARSRRQDIIVDDEILYQFYDERLPQDIYNGPLFMRWLKQCTTAEAEKLFLSREYLMQHDAAHITVEQFPDQLEMNGCRYPISYHFDPNHQRDGITLVTPLAGLHAISPQRCEWLVPGMLHAKMVALLRSLPKSLRRSFVPVPDFASACMQALEPSDTALTTAMSKQLKNMTGVEIAYDAWRPEQIDPHLFMNYRVIDADSNTLIEGRDLAQLQQQLSSEPGNTTVQADAELANTLNSIDQDDVGPGILDQIPSQLELELHGVKIQAWPALVKQGGKVMLRCMDSRQKAEDETRTGLRQLFINALPQQIKHLKKNIPGIQKLCLQYADFGSCDELRQDILSVVIDQCFMQEPVNSMEDYTRALHDGKHRLMEVAEKYSALLSLILDEYKRIKKELKTPSLALLDTVADIQKQLGHLFPRHFLLTIDSKWIQQYPRYLRAIGKRLEKARDNSARDRQLRLHLSKLWDEYIKRHETLLQQNVASEQLDEYRWMIEEYRVSLYAQELKTLFPVSEKRLKTCWNEI